MTVEVSFQSETPPWVCVLCVGSMCLCLIGGRQSKNSAKQLCLLVLSTLLNIAQLKDYWAMVLIGSGEPFEVLCFIATNSAPLKR